MNIKALILIGSIVYYIYKSFNKVKTKAAQNKGGTNQPKYDPFKEFEMELKNISNQEEEEQPNIVEESIAAPEVKDIKARPVEETTELLLNEDEDDAQEELRFNLRQAVINDAILNRPYVF